MEYLKTIGITCAAIGIYHLLVSRNYRNKIEIHLRLIEDLQRILGNNIRTQSYILDRIEDLEDNVSDDVSDSENDDETDSEDSDNENENIIRRVLRDSILDDVLDSEDSDDENENMILPESNATNEV